MQPSTKRLLVALPMLALAFALGGLGWYWQATLQCTEIELTGAYHAEAGVLRELAGVDTGLVLFQIDPRLVADRLRRHPWVREADAMRLPTGVLRLHVEERRPVVLVLGREGDPAYYLDRDGYAMPARDDHEAVAAYDVPVLRGLRAPYHPVQPTGDATVRALLAAVSAARPEARALVSELELSGGEVTMRTTPTMGPGAVPVRLGEDDFGARLDRLVAFWQQAVLTRPERRFEVIDLRFDGHVITREMTDS